MADETTTTSVTECVTAEWIRPVINHCAKGRTVVARHAIEFDIRGMGTPVVALPREVLDASEGSGINGYDLATETTALSNTEFETLDATVTPGEYGLKRTITYKAGEDNVLGFQGLVDRIVESGATDMAVCLDDDAAALLGSFSNTVGTTTVDLSLANMAQAVSKLSGLEMPNDGGAVFCVDKQQATDYAAALVAATGTTLASFFTKPEEANGLVDGYWGTWMGCPIYSTSLCDTANAGEDVAGALFLRGDGGRNPMSAAIASATKRDVDIRFWDDISNRAIVVVITQRKGVAEMLDASGISIITDA